MASGRVQITITCEVLVGIVYLRRDCCRQTWEQWFALHGIDPAEALSELDPLTEQLGRVIVRRDLGNSRIVIEARPRREYQLEAAPLQPPYCDRDHSDRES